LDGNLEDSQKATAKLNASWTNPFEKYGSKGKANTRKEEDFFKSLQAYEEALAKSGGFLL
jgi:hypothetical protein